MKISKLYSNQHRIFEPITFSAGLNVVLAEIRLPENRLKDTHNLGKTTLGRLLDFMLLSKRDPKMFLFKHSEKFGNFVFFVELELDESRYLTIRRSVDESSKISFKRHSESQDLSNILLDDWDHQEVPFERARELLDGILDWRYLKPWDFRDALGYLLRSQDDFRDVFHLKKFAGPHVNWKPFLAHILGFNAEILLSFYQKTQQISAKQETVKTLTLELGGNAEDISKIEGILLLKLKEADKKQVLLNAFDFREQDKDQTKHLVDNVDERIAELNAKRYSLAQTKKKIQTSLEDDQILFSPSEAQRLFAEAGVFFAGQIKKDFEQLIDFNRAISEERRGYLKEERKEVESELKKISAELEVLGLKRSEMLAFLSETDVFDKYKKVSEELVLLRTDIASLEKQRGYLHRLQELRAEIRLLTEEHGSLQSQIEKDVENQNSDQNSLFSTIRLFFSEIIEEVVDRKALLSVSANQHGNLEFKAEILDEAGNATSADLGHTYRKLLCVAFDLAVLRAHFDDKFPHFVYHDGVFESLDDRKKENLLGVFRKYSDLGMQEIITLIDSDLPARDNDEPVFSPDEITLVLHDEDASGRLFKMDGW